MQIGKYKLKIINSGFIGLDGGAMFGIIPKPIWQKTNPPDEQNRVTLATRNLLLESDSKKILIDTGMGVKWDKKAKEIYRIYPDIEIEFVLKQQDILLDQITDVILTHLHFDHAGGSTKLDNAKLIPTFPNARYYVQKKNFLWGMNPSERDRGSYIKDNFEPLAQEGILNFTNENDFFDDEIQFKVINGHSFGQQMIKISDGSTTLLYCSDLIPFVSQIRIPYIMAYDLQPLVTIEEKKKYLKLAANEDWYLFFGHDPEIALAKVKHSENGIVQNKVYNSFSEI